MANRTEVESWGAPHSDRPRASETASGEATAGWAQKDGAGESHRLRNKSNVKCPSYRLLATTTQHRETSQQQQSADRLGDHQAKHGISRTFDEVQVAPDCVD